LLLCSHGSNCKALFTKILQKFTPIFALSVNAEHIRKKLIKNVIAYTEGTTLLNIPGHFFV